MADRKRKNFGSTGDQEVEKPYQEENDIPEVKVNPKMIKFLKENEPEEE